MSKSSKLKFEIAPPDAQPIKKLHKLIGEHVSYADCIFFQISALWFRSKKNSYYKVVENLRKFYKYSDLLPTVL